MFWLLMIIPAAIGNYLVINGVIVFLSLPARQSASRRTRSRMRKEAQGFRLIMTGALLVIITTIFTLITTI